MNRKFIIRTIAFLMLYLAAASYMLQNEEKFFFKHDQLEKDFTYVFTVPFEERFVQVNKELMLSALYFTQENSKGLVLYFPDGDYISTEYNPSANYFYSNGYSLLIPDYRGTGKTSSHFQNEKDIFEDALQWYKMAHRIADTTPLIICGKEFGSGIAAQVGGGYPADLLWLENPYYAWNEIMLKEYFWWLPHTWFTQYKIPLWEYIRKSNNRIVLVHSSKNKDFPINNSHRLLEYLKPGDDLIELDGEEIDDMDADFQKSMEKIGFR